MFREFIGYIFDMAFVTREISIYKCVIILVYNYTLYIVTRSQKKVNLDAPVILHNTSCNWNRKHSSNMVHILLYRPNIMVLFYVHPSERVVNSQKKNFNSIQLCVFGLTDFVVT